MGEKRTAYKVLVWESDKETTWKSQVYMTQYYVNGS